MREALADIPQKRLAGLVIVSDGQVHDVPPTARELGITAPVHLAMTGDPAGRDRRMHRHAIADLRPGRQDAST